MNRHQRRVAVKDRGESWRRHQLSAKFVRQAREMEAKGLKMTPDQAREALARWAAAGGHIPLAEVQREEMLAGVTLGDLK